MSLTRREAMVLGLGAAGALMLAPALATTTFAKEDLTEAAISKFAGGATPQTGKISLNTPEIAENGNTVPISFSVESPMTDEDHVKEVLILADGNPNPGVAKFNFTSMSGEAQAATRVRLAKTQNVVAVAKMSDGSVYMDKKEIKVTIGGCGG
jgi:sulfur-oxidizing protein SoxY